MCVCVCVCVSHTHTHSHTGMWGGKLPSTWEVIDAEMYAILAYLRKMASASDAQSRRCLILCDCKPAPQQID